MHGVKRRARGQIVLDLKASLKGLDALHKSSCALLSIRTELQSSYRGETPPARMTCAYHAALVFGIRCKFR